MKLLAALAAAVLAVASPAQDRHARLQLHDGEVVVGRVVSLDDHRVKVFVDGRVRTIDARTVRSCRIDAAPPPAPVAVDAPSAPAGETALPTPLPDVIPADAPAAPNAEASPLSRRLAVLDAHCPWLRPATPLQWGSLAFLVWIACAYAVRASAAISGAEAPALGRSLGIALWYGVTACGQFAYVPGDDFAVTAMLLLNPAVALWLLRRAFALPRVGALMALAVQLGFAVVAFGVLELVTSVLGAVGML